MTMHTTPNRGSVEQSLRWIGDLDHPHYADERNRFVWYEASAIGFQFLLVLQLWLVGAGMLVFGESARLLAFLLVPVVFSAVVVEGYARAKNSPYFYEHERITRGRTLLALASGLVLVAGFVRAGIFGWGDDVETDAASIAGLVVGLAFGVGVILTIAWAMRRRTAASTIDED